MTYFMDTVETIADGVGFAHFDATHLAWLAFFLILTVTNCLWYRKLGTLGRRRWRHWIAGLLVADELFKCVMLIAGGRFAAKYLPFHLCSINIFVILAHSWKPGKTIGSFLYTVGIPGTAFALLFPTWTELPAWNFMHIHSFTVHILLMLYPVALTAAGEIEIDPKAIPKCLGLLACLAAVAFVVNRICDTNFMFLRSVGKGNPLYWFQRNWGSHYLGFPVLIGAVLVVMYVPAILWRRLRGKITV